MEFIEMKGHNVSYRYKTAYKSFASLYLLKCSSMQNYLPHVEQLKREFGTFRNFQYIRVVLKK